LPERLVEVGEQVFEITTELVVGASPFLGEVDQVRAEGGLVPLQLLHEAHIVIVGCFGQHEDGKVVCFEAGAEVIGVASGRQETPFVDDLRQPIAENGLYEAFLRGEVVVDGEVVGRAGFCPDLA
jgi:hypothetical protein